MYVAMTRAKRNLTIHYNVNYLDFLKAGDKAEDLKIIDNPEAYAPPSQ
ncbi:MAG: hypothetical protein ACYDEJ_13170 [Desulfitobacteriaceae bacterium]